MRSTGSAQPIPGGGVASLLAATVLVACLPIAAAALEEDLDPAFGNGGIVSTSILGGGGAGALVRQSDGRLVAGGSVTRVLSPPELGQYSVFGLARYLDDGTADPSFGASGIVTTEPAGADSDGARLRGLALQSDGKIVAVGHLGDDASPTRLLLARYHPDGSLDAGFGSGGVVQLAPAFQSEVEGLAVQGDGRIVAVGSIADGAGLVRLDTDGSLDPGFGNGGIVQGPLVISASLSSVSLRADGRLFTGGRHFNVAENRSEWAVVQYTGSGDADTDFSGDGIDTIASGFDPGARAVLAQSDGRAVAAGAGANPTAFLLARYRGAAEPIAGRRLVLKSRAAAPGKKRLKLVSVDAARIRNEALTPADPVHSAAGGSVRVLTSAGDAFDDSYHLPAAGWSYLGEAADNRGYAYSDPLGQITRVEVRNGRRLKVVGKGEALGHTLLSDPAPVVVVVTVGESSYGMTFGGTSSFAPDKRFRATRPGVASLCP